MSHSFQLGDAVIYRKTKFSDHPGPRAANVNPAPNGDEYSYTVDKYWVIQEITGDGTLVLRTRRGKLHHVPPEDPSLHRASWWQRWLHADRYRAIRQEMQLPDSAALRASESPTTGTAATPTHS